MLNAQCATPYSVGSTRGRLPLLRSTQSRVQGSLICLMALCHAGDHRETDIGCRASLPEHVRRVHSCSNVQMLTQYFDGLTQTGTRQGVKPNEALARGVFSSLLLLGEWRLWGPACYFHSISPVKVCNIPSNGIDGSDSSLSAGGSWGSYQICSLDS